MHVLIDSETKLAEQITITNAVVHDMNAIRGTIEFKKGDIYVYDRGNACYNYLYEIASAKAFFVTRIKSNWKFRVVKNKKVSKCKGIRKDQIIKVTGNKKGEYPEQLRLVTFYHEESKKLLKFLTNNFCFSIVAGQKRIADIYKMRWQIELFFKWIKQHLKIKTFLSTTPNGVKIQIWSELITYVMLYLVKSRLLYDMDIFEIARRIQEHLFSKIDLYDLLTCQIPKKNKPDNYGQWELEYA